MKTLILSNCSLRRFTPIFLFVFIWSVSFGQQDIAINLHGIISSRDDSDAGMPANNYLLVNAENKVSSKYKSMDIKISTEDSGTMSLNIQSNRNQNVLIEIKNNLDDELLFKPVHLKKGNNIISFDTDEVPYFLYLKIGKIHADNCGSFIVFRK